MKRALLMTLWILLFTGTLHASTYDFEYSYGDPNLATSQTYIESTSNAELRLETSYHYWKPIVGATTEDDTMPGVITYHFNFSDTIDKAYLYLRLDTFCWSYSKGHDFLFASTDGSSWQQISEVLPPTNISGWTGGGWNGLLPDSVVGTNDIWLQARLYSFGPSATSGGAMTNTAQLSRYDVGNQNMTTFRLGVDFVTAPVPEPGTMLLFGLGLLGLSGISRKRKP